MSEELYPADLQITVEDFMTCGWKEILAGIPEKCYPSMFEAFSSGAKKAIKEQRFAHGKVLRLLASVCSMMLDPDSRNIPFKPYLVIEGQRSSIPDDFNDNDILLFSQIAEEVDDIWLKARLTDLVWFKKRSLGLNFALTAIDSYRSIPLDAETWVRGGDNCWGRALNLTCMLGKGAGNRLVEMESAILDKVCTATSEEGFLCLWLSDLLKKYHLVRDQSIHIAQKLELLACEFDKIGDFYKAREYYDSSSTWFRLTGNTGKSTEMTIRVAEGWAKEALSRCSIERPSHMAATMFYENAIQVYRTIPRSERGAYQVDERIAELRTHLNQSGEKALTEFQLISTLGIDISSIVENSRNAVSGKSLHDALTTFVNLHQFTNASQAKSTAVERVRKHPLTAIFPKIFFSQDGRVIAQCAGVNLGENVSGDEKAILAQMIHDHGIMISMVVQGYIWPALEIIHMEHRLREIDFISIAKQSPIVPKGRERLFGKGLFAGYDLDFTTALHLLIPQIEHMVRFHLKEAGVKTSNLDSNGIESENSLNTLMETPEVTKIFGEDLSFEIKALFCDAFGPNLRNELAHGLITEDGCYSVYGVYAWWLILKIVFCAFWNAERQND